MGADFVMITRHSLIFSRSAAIFSAFGVGCAIWIHVAFFHSPALSVWREMPRSSLTEGETTASGFWLGLSESPSLQAVAALGFPNLSSKVLGYSGSKQESGRGLYRVTRVCH